MKTVIPNNNFVFAEPDEVVTQSASGFKLGTGAREEPKTAVIISMGNSVVGFKAGDRIAYKDYTTTDITLDGKTYIMLEDIDILCKIVETEN